MKYLGIIFLFAVSADVFVSTALGQGENTVSAATVEKAMPASAVDEERYRIGLQDVLQVEVFKHGELTQRVAVGPTGKIMLFRLKSPLVALCKTEDELADDIAAAYKTSFVKDPQVKVTVTEQKSQSIGVMGAVERPGNFFISRRVHLIELLALAGGPNKEAGTRLIVARTGSTSNCNATTDASADAAIEILSFKVRDIQEGKQSIWMKPGDVVSVFDADIVYVYGNVNEQGSVKIREPITLTQAIVSAKGLKPSASKSNIRILRAVPGSTDRKEFVFDLNAIDKGKVKDPYLEPGDIVAVSQDTTKAILHGIGDAIKGSVPAAAYRL